MTNALNYLGYYTVSAVVTWYVAPFQVEGSDSIFAAILKVLPLIYLAYSAQEQQKSLTNYKNKFFREQKHLLVWTKWAFLFSAVGDFFMVRILISVP